MSRGSAHFPAAAVSRERPASGPWSPRPPLLGVRAPLLAPAVAWVAGAWLAGRALPLPVPALLALAALAFALRRPPAAWLGWLAIALVWAEVRWAGPRRELLALQPGRPVALTGEVSGCWSRDASGDGAWLALRWVRQGRLSRPAAGRVRIHVPAGTAGGGCGGVVRVRGTLRGPRTYRNAIPITVGGWSVWVKSAALYEQLAPPDPLARASGALRARLFPDSAAEPRPGLSLARAFLLGDGAALPPEQREAMRRLGLAHLVAVSGLNVGMVAAFLLVALVRAPRRVRLFGTLLGILTYALLVGPLPSLLRALLMAAVVLVALMLRRLPAAVNALAAACLLLVVLDPAWVDDLGFQLSVAATVGLMALTPAILELLRPLRWLAPPLAVTLAAQLATLPWALAEFHRLSPAAPLANLVAVPWAGLALGGALVWGLARLFAGPPADALLPALDLLAAPLPWLERVPGGSWVSIPLSAGWAVAVTATGLLCWALLRPRPAGWAAARVAAAVGLVVAVQPPVPAGLEAVAFDVGQGDALLLRDGDQALLVDGGGWRGPGFGGRVLLPALGGLGVRRLAAVAVTHADEDHCGGAADLVRELAVGEVWAPAGLPATGCGRRLVPPWAPPARELVLGERLALGRWRIDVLAPAADDRGPDNHRSLVLRARAAGRCLLLTGDLDVAGERVLLRRHDPATLGCELLKVAHHGSRSSTGKPFLAAVRPRLAVISAGAGNPYGHPSAPVLAALAGAGVRTVRTDRDGMVRLAWGEGRPLRVVTAAP